MFRYAIVAICGLATVIGLLLRNPVWILGGLGGVGAALLMPLEIPSAGGH